MKEKTYLKSLTITNTTKRDIDTGNSGTQNIYILHISNKIGMLVEYKLLRYI